jgi:hypothetical protein
MAGAPQGIILILFGIFICFAGYGLFRSMLPLWGFILGGLITITVGGGLAALIPVDPFVAQIGLFILGGIVGALISAPLYYVAVFATGAALGGLMGIVFGAYLEISGGAVSVKALSTLSALAFPPPVNSSLQFVFMVLFALITGGFAISFQKFMITASTAFIGAAAFVSGLNNSAFALMRDNPSKGIWIVAVWFLMSLLGLFIQYRMRDET